jgi:hypothetical protein
MNSESTRAPVFPYGLPRTKPDILLSRAMERLYTQYPAPTTWWNKLFTLFRYTPLEGLEYNDHDGTLTRRDPSKVIKVNGKYYTWYTRRSSAVPPRGPGAGTDDIPSTDWDLAEIWYATSNDGFVWEEQGLAVPAGVQGQDPLLLQVEPQWPGATCLWPGTGDCRRSTGTI